MLRKHTPPEELFWRYVNKDGPIPEARPDLGPCWLWTGAKDKGGYGRFNAERVMMTAHAFLVGKAPNGLEWDHLCRVTLCVRPLHLEAVTHQVNMQRGKEPPAYNFAKVVCLHGHSLSGDNLSVNNRGERVCLTCAAARARQYRLKLQSVVS